MGPMPPRLWLTLSDHLFAGRAARMFHVEHLTSALPGRSLVLAKVTSPAGVTLARSLRSRLARLFHVEHLTCLRNLVVANPTSAFVAAPCPPYSAGASPDCSSGGALGKKQGTDEISLVSVPSFGTDTYRRHLFAREPCSNVPRETRHAWTCRTKCRTCESGPHSHLALCRFTRPSAGASHECSTWNT